MAKRQAKGSRSRKHSRLVRKWDGSPVTATQPNTTKRSMRALQTQLEQQPEDTATRLELADRMLVRGKAADAHALLDAPESPLRGSGRGDDYWTAARMMAFALAKLKKYEAACELAEQVVAERPEALDFHYVLAYAAGRHGDHARARVESHRPAAASGIRRPRFLRVDRETGAKVRETCDQSWESLGATGLLRRA